MEFFVVLATRHSIRAFAAQAIEPKKQAAILDAANRAPSAGNLQGYEIYAISRPEIKERLKEAVGDEFMTQAPLILVFCANPGRSAPRYGERGRDLYAVQDATIACTYAQLAATALGLGSVWVGAFNEESVQTAIGVGRELRPVAMLPIGYPAEEPKIRGRRSLDDLVHYRV